MKNTIFTGAASAIITPMHKDGSVDFESFGRLIDWQIEHGIDAIVAVGTTGESATLADDEHMETVKYCIDRVAGRVPVIAGTGSNNTDHAIMFTKEAYKLGADAVLLVTPYYNKTTQNGLYESFKAIAESAPIPCVIYNVPSRTGCNLQPATVARLAEIPNIVAVKEASGNISQVAEIAALCGDKIDIYSGNDDQIVPILSLGGKGVISVLADICPQETHDMCQAYFDGDIDKARELQLKYLPLVDALFCEVNPIPVKAACAAMGFCENVVRLPLVKMEAEHEENLLKIMRDLKLI